MNAIESRLLFVPIVGRHLRGANLAEQMQVMPGAGLWVFLRHFSCIFCREMVRDVMKASLQDGYPPVLLFCQASVEEAGPFFEKYAPSAAVVCDPGKVFYDGMQLGSGTFAQMFGPRVWGCGMRATMKGNTIGNPMVKPIGDPWTMPGVFVVDRAGQILWKHHFEHSGDHPEWEKIPSLLSQGAAESQRV
jgi:hypothetical protein